MSKDQLWVRIGPKRTALQVAIAAATLVSAPLVPATYNHFVLGGSWVIDIFSILIGMLCVVAAFESFNPKNASFETPGEAADWVRSEEWRTPHAKGDENA